MKNNSSKKNFKSGFVSIIGRPNVGKSTLMNSLVGEKIAIMSDKPQTTRNQIRAIYNDDEMQIVFMDTPGIQKPQNRLGDYMLKVSHSSMRDTDVILFVVDDSKSIGKKDSDIIETLKTNKSKKILAINKIDKLSMEELDVKFISDQEDVISVEADGTLKTGRYFKEDVFTLYESEANGSFGTGLWGVTPEELEYRQFIQEENRSFVTLSMWATQDPVAVWTKASGMFVPVAPKANGGIVIGTKGE